MHTPPRILIVEEDSQIALTLGESVQKGVRAVVEVCPKLDEAVRRSCAATYSLVLVGAVMADPRMGGVEEVRRRFSIPVVFALPHARLAGALGLDSWEWVSSPFGPAEVSKAVTFALRAQTQELKLKELQKRLREEQTLADLGRSVNRAGADFLRVVEELNQGVRALQTGANPAQGELLLQLEQAVRRAERLASQLTGAPAIPAPESTVGRVLLHTRKQTVLVVDDEESIRELAACVIRQMGWQVVTARDGEEAFLRFQTDPGLFCAVLLDLSLPRLSGLEVISGIRSLRPTMPVVMITGHGEEALASDARLALSGLLHKPFSTDALRSVLQRAVATHANAHSASAA